MPDKDKQLAHLSAENRKNYNKYMQAQDENKDLKIEIARLRRIVDERCEDCKKDTLDNKDKF